jgi:transcriptional regulator with XRE-family HTH domain
MSELSESIGKVFGTRLAAARRKAKLTQEELGYLSAIHRTEIGKLERGTRTPRLDTVIKLAGAMNIEPCELIGDLRWTPPSLDSGSGGLHAA